MIIIVIVVIVYDSSGCENSSYGLECPLALPCRFSGKRISQSFALAAPWEASKDNSLGGVMCYAMLLIPPLAHDTISLIVHVEVL